MPVLHGFPYPCSHMLSRQLIVGFIASLFMFSATELHQLLRIPELVIHYNQHSRKDSSMSVRDFLQLHYAMAHPVDNDEQDDEELPFKSMAGIYHLDPPWPSPQLILTAPCYPQSTVYPVYYQEGNLSHFVDGIFHPPRFV